MEPRDAATVMLLRPLPGDHGPDALGAPDARGCRSTCSRRQPSMAFAPGAFVFPGGSVDARDAEIEVGWAWLRRERAG